MVDKFCSYHLKGLGQISHFHEPTLLSLSVLNFIFSPVATFGNILVIRALWKASSIPANVKRLLLSLAVSDLAVGLFAQPMYAVMLRMAAYGEHNSDLLCPTILTVCYFFKFLVSCASFLNVTAIAVDRLLAITLHLRYQELVTSKRVIIFVLSLWLTSGASAAVYLSLDNRNNILVVIVEFVGFLFTTVAYIHIYRAVRHHQNQIHSQLRQQNVQAVELFRETKSAFNTSYFYIIFVACNLPFLCSTMTVITDSSRCSFWVAYHVSFVFIPLNSSLNPLVYCWRYREIRQILKSTLSKMCCISIH